MKRNSNNPLSVEDEKSLIQSGETPYINPISQFPLLKPLTRFNMIEFRIPTTPSEDKLKLLDKYEPYMFGRKYTYIHLLKKDTNQVRKLIIDNGIAKPDEIEEIDSCDWNCPVDKMTDMMEFLQSKNIDFQTIAYVFVKLPKKERDDFVNWQRNNMILRESTKLYFNIPEQKITVFQDACTKFYLAHKDELDDVSMSVEDGGQVVTIESSFVEEFKKYMMENNFMEK